MSWNEESEIPKPTLRYLVTKKYEHGTPLVTLQELRTIFDPDGFITGTKWVNVPTVYEEDLEGSM